MLLSQAFMFSGVFSLYIGFSAVLGYLVHSTRGPSYRSAGWAIVLAYTILIWLPTSAFIITLDWLSMILRILSIIGGTATTVLITFRPKWLPELVWTRSFNRMYLGITMVLVALGTLIPWLPDPNAGALTVGLAACAAGLSAIRDTTAPV